MAIDMNIEAAAGDHALERKLDKVGWGLSLIWVGVAILGSVGWGLGLLGLGLIVLGGHALRRYAGLRVDWFGIILGLCFFLIGLKQILHIRIGDGNLLPILSIVLGSVFLVSVLLKQKSNDIG